MRRVVLVFATMALAILVAGGVAQAIINGEPDRGPNAHPYVGALVTKVGGQVRNFCSGTLISPQVFLTAGHCTEPPKGAGLPKDLPTYVTFDPTFESGSSALIKGTPYTHPKFCFPIPPINDPSCTPPPGLPRFPSEVPRYDVGVVVLNKPVRMATYGALPDAGLVDTLEWGQRFTTVGYGFRANARPPAFDPPPPEFDPPGGERYRATVRLLNTNDALGDQFVKTTGVSLIRGKGEGTCFGDSGGPLFMPDQQTVVGVSSFVSTAVCRGPAYYQRVDLPRVLKWVRSFP